MEILLVQMAIERGKPGLNRARLQTLTANLKTGTPALLVLPELFSTGYVDEAYLKSMTPAQLTAQTAEDADCLARLARRLGCWVAGGVAEFPASVEPTTAFETAAGGGAQGEILPRFRNASLLFDPKGEPRGQYRKIHPFSFGGEDMVLSRGTEVVTVDLEGWVVQPTLCYDLRFPELYRAGSLRGTHLILVQANWPDARQAHWEILLKARAVENQAYVAGVNCVGTQGGLRYAGGSMLISPKGELVAQGGVTQGGAKEGGSQEGAAEGVTRARLDLDYVKQWRRQFPALRDRMPEGFYGD